MLLSWQRPAHLFLIAVVAALGSVLGSLVLYHIARTKGDAWTLESLLSVHLQKPFKKRLTGRGGPGRRTVVGPATRRS